MFIDCDYINEGDSGVFLLYIEKIFSDALSAESIIRNVNFTNIKTNALSFGGFEEVDPDNWGGGDFVVSQVRVTDSTFISPDNLLRTKKYSYPGRAKFIMKDSEFSGLRFDKFGNILSFSHNAKESIDLLNVTFKDIYGAGIRLEPQDIFDKENPL